MFKDLEPKIKALIAKFKQKAFEQDPDAKKKKSKKVQIIIIAGVAFYGALELFFPDQNEKSEPVASKQEKNSIPSSDNLNNTVDPVDEADATPETSSEKLEDAISEKVEEAISSDNQEKLDNNIELESNTETEVTETAPPEINVLSSTEDENNEEPQITPTPEITPEVSATPEATIISETESGTISEVITDNSETNVKVEDKPAVGQNIEEIIKKVESESLQMSAYAAPPDYSKLGRGLVYNCKERHWACVDRESYVKCLNNENWAKQNKKGKECVPREVYASDDDCQVVQTYNINMLVKTDFCFEN